MAGGNCFLKVEWFAAYNAKERKGEAKAVSGSREDQVIPRTLNPACGPEAVPFPYDP